MTPVVSLLIAVAYLATAIMLATKEYNIIQRHGADSFTVVLAFVFIYLLLPGVGIHALFGIYGPSLRSGNSFFDKIYDQLNSVESLIVFFLTLLFITGLYIAGGLQRLKRKKASYTKLRELQPRELIIWVSIFVGMAICTKFFLDLGENFLERYAGLILFRNLDSSIERTFFSANAFSLTQTLTWLSAGVFFLYLSSGQKSKSLVFFFIMLFSAFLMGSRRGLIFPLLIVYLSSILLYSNLHLKKLLFIIPIIILWIGFGKELTGSIAYDGETSEVLSNYESTGSLFLRAFSDIGISQVQSFGVLQHFGFSPRLGVDHLLSVLRRLPDGMIGLDIDWPERIVRITTHTFASMNDADIPPGLVGQSWLDLPIFGALAWGLIIGIQCRFLNQWMSRTTHSPAKAVFITLLGTVIALPINTGSFDFTFSVDIIFMVALLLFFFHQKKLQHPPFHKSFVHE